MTTATALKITSLTNEKIMITTMCNSNNKWTSALYAIGEIHDELLLSIEGFPFNNKEIAEAAMHREIKQAKEFVWEYFCPN